MADLPRSPARSRSTKARHSIASFKLREGMTIGAKVTLRQDRMYEFLDRLITVALPRVKDFRGLKPTSFDGRGNYAMGLKEHIVFPEINYDEIDQIWGMDIVVGTTARTDDEARALLQGIPVPVHQARREGGRKEQHGQEKRRQSQPAGQALVKQYAAKREALKATANNESLPLEERFEARLKLAELPRNSSKTRIRNRCEVTGRPRAYYRKLKMSRISLRDLGSHGLIPGLVKSSW